MIDPMLDLSFPSLRRAGFEITSPHTEDYNCIAWAAGDTNRWWWPDKYFQYYWPADAPRNESLQAFIETFEKMGYLICGNHDLEEGIEKICIYIRPDGTPTHAARQLENGKWTSKLGRSEDIEHQIDSLDGPSYGSVAVIMQRPFKTE